MNFIYENCFFFDINTLYWIQYTRVNKGEEMHLDKLVTVVGAHAEGEVGRVITGGVLPPKGKTMFECMQDLQTNNDWVRQMLLFDPRGSVNTAINLITPPVNPAADIGMIVIESDYYVPMSGSNLICTVTVALETGLLPMKGKETVVIVDTPAGLVKVIADCSNNKCNSISFTNIPSFVMNADQIIDVPSLGRVNVDISYGGMIYAIVDAKELGFTLHRDEARDLVHFGELIKLAAAEQIISIHPENPRIHTVNQTLFGGPIIRTEEGLRSKNAVVVSPGRLDRCPCGTGTSARLALMHSKGQINIYEKFFHESILDTVFESSIIEETTLETSQIKAVTPVVKGRAWLTGVSQYGVDSDDPFPNGYRLNDTWFK